MMCPRSSFSPAQQQVLNLISAGSTISACARQTGIHRNTIHNWLRSSDFRNAVEQARYDNAIHWYEQAITLAEAAFHTLTGILDNSEAPASVRARIALAIMNRAVTPPPKPPFVGSFDDPEELESHPPTQPPDP